LAKKIVTATVDFKLWEEARAEKLNISRAFNDGLKERLEEKRGKETKGVIVADGKSTRLYPITTNTPKCLLEVGGKALLDHAIERFEEAGITDITIVTGFGESQVRNHCNKRKNIKFVFNPFFATTNILASLWFAREELDSELVFSYSDILCTSKAFNDLVKRKEGVIALVAKTKVDPESEKVKEKNGKIIEISKDVPDADASGEFIGIVKFSENGARELKKVLEETVREDTFRDYYFTVVLERLVQKGIDVYVSYTSQPWIEIDFPNELDLARNEVWPKIKRIDSDR